MSTDDEDLRWQQFRQEEERAYCEQQEAAYWLDWGQQASLDSMEGIECQHP